MITATEEKEMVFNFNPRKYEELLSSFGRNVLKILLKQHAESEHRTTTQRQAPIHIQNKRILTSKGNNKQLNYENKLDENFLNLSAIENHMPNVPKSTELVKSVDVNEEAEYLDLPGDSIIFAAPDYKQKTCNLVYDLFNNSSQEFNGKGKIDDSIINKSNDVAWSDMFDTELIHDIYNPDIDIQGCGNNNLEEIRFKSFFPNEIQIGINKVNDRIELGQSTKEMNKKRKTQTKITDAVPKKVKKVVNDEFKTKNTYRKQKYTKTVKNWLNDVDANNPVEEEILEKNNNENEMEIKKHTITIEKALDKTKKRVIQAQLANKDGIMKFGKPKTADNGKNKTNLKESESKVNQEIVKDKDRKAKSKFVTPIKSQIPVKDLTYAIHIVDDLNKEEVGNKLNNIQNKEVMFVLHYNNGFSQLNSHHTDDSCVPEGIFTGVEDHFYYFNGALGKQPDIIIKLIKENKIIGYDCKNVLSFIKSHFATEVYDINIIDAKIGGCLLSPDNPPENFSELQKLVSFMPQYTIATECLMQKTAWYMTMLRECVVTLERMLMENSLWNVFVEIEMRLLPIIADMELRGVSVDLDILKSMEAIILTKMKAVEQECYNAAGKIFQINSALQVRAILYDELKLDTKCNIKIRETITKGAKSTSETMLRSLMSEHPLPKLILEYRHLHKAHATFLTGIAQHVKNGIVKPTWVQTAAATGRIASNNPNLQAIPKAPFSLVMFPESNKHEEAVLSFRSVYISRAGWSLVAADFKHVECRVFAHAAADTGLLDALKTGHDLFRVLAAKWLNKPESTITSDDRERTKRIVYASLYGAGARKLMDILDVNYDQALSIAASFNRTFPSLKSFGRGVVSRCEQSAGRLSTLSGRVRHFANITSGDFALRSHAERQAVNFVVQGSAADLCKMAMITTAKALRESSPPVEGRLVLQIHDELVWEVHDRDLERAAVLIKHAMENCGRQCGMAMTLPVSTSRGKNWGNMVEDILK